MGSPSGPELALPSRAHCIARYDALGRVVQRGELELEYGATGDIEGATVGARHISFTYDENQTRILKVEESRPTEAYFDQGVLTETGLVARVEIAGQVMGLYDQDGFHFLPTDSHGTVFASNEGAISLASPYGVRRTHGASSSFLDYAAKGYDADLGTVRMGARDYDPTLGMFWGPDPLMLTTPGKCAEAPEQCNLYGYAVNDPVMFADPTGLFVDRHGGEFSGPANPNPLAREYESQLDRHAGETMWHMSEN